MPVLNSGVHPGFFIGGGGGGAGGRVHHYGMGKLNGEVFFFFCKIPVTSESRRSSQGGGGPHPLHPSPRSAPETLLFPVDISLIYRK